VLLTTRTHGRITAGGAPPDARLAALSPMPGTVSHASQGRALLRGLTIAHDGKLNCHRGMYAVGVATTVAQGTSWRRRRMKGTGPVR